MPLPSNFMPINGGAGVSVPCNTSSSTRVALPTPEDSLIPNAIAVSNTGVFYAHAGLGDSTLQATTAYQAISPGDQIAFPFPFAGGSGAPTYVAGISIDGSTTLQVTLGVLL
jgi:hypothetical protein